MINNNNLLLIHPILKEHVLNPQEVRCLQCYLVNYLRGIGQNVFTKTSVTLVLENPFTDNREDLQIPLFWVIIHFFFFFCLTWQSLMLIKEVSSCSQKRNGQNMDWCVVTLAIHRQLVYLDVWEADKPGGERLNMGLGRFTVLKEKWNNTAFLP